MAPRLTKSRLREPNMTHCIRPAVMGLLALATLAVAAQCEAASAAPKLKVDGAKIVAQVGPGRSMRGAAEARALRAAKGACGAARMMMVAHVHHTRS